jgi:Restriction endonuclease BglII
MRCAQIKSHHHGVEECRRRNIEDFAIEVFNAPHVMVSPNGTDVIRGHVRDALADMGWSGEARIKDGYQLTVFSLHDDVGFQFQTGNVSRAFYDLLKLQYLYIAGRISVAISAVPTKDAAEVLGSNIANYERLTNELDLFDRVISVPIMIIGFQ